MKPDSEITVVKCNHRGEEVFRWKGRLLERDGAHIKIEARFGLSGLFMGEAPLYVGDRFVEDYYSDRWYNSFEVHDRNTDQVKCWYCNVAYPAEITADTIWFRDLALDLLVYPDGRQQVLDEAEFEELKVPQDDQTSALAALEELKELFRKKLQK
jgi:hypothetical protein